MKVSINQLKKQVKHSFKNNWLTAIQITFIPAVGTIIALFVVAIETFVKYLSIKSLPLSLSQLTINTATQSIDPIQEITAVLRNLSSLISQLIMSVLSGVTVAGISWTFLDWFRKDSLPKHPIKESFQGFNKSWLSILVILAFLIWLYTKLWTLLLIIPGIIMSYAYRMVYFIRRDEKLQNQTVSYLVTISHSKQLMKGYKWRLFVLDLSFVGWFILSILGLGMPLFWVLPYYYATNSAFYQAISKTAEA